MRGSLLSDNENWMDLTIAPGDGNQLIFVTEERPVVGRLAVWLVPHEEVGAGDMSDLTERDLSVLEAFIRHAHIRLNEEKNRRGRARVEAQLRESDG